MTLSAASEIMAQSYVHRFGVQWSGEMPVSASIGVPPYRIFNIGNEVKVELLRYVKIFEDKPGRKAIRELLPLQAGSVPNTETLTRSIAVVRI